MLPSNIAALIAEFKWADALLALEQGLVAEPKNTVLLGNKGICLRRLGRYSEAEAVFQAILSIYPDNASAWNSLGNLLKEAGDIEEALPALEKAARLGKRPEFFSDWLFALNYSPFATQKELFDAHLEYRSRVTAAPAASEAAPRKPGLLRLGFVSADFCRHSVSYFFRPLLRHLDRQRFDVFCYSDVAQPDNTTELIRKDAGHWIDSHAMSHADLEQRMRADDLDILVDLSGHTGNNRLPVMARRPARLQLSWLGYPNTTGLDSIDFRLVDSVTDPEGAADGLHSEALLRLPGTFLCYEGVSLAKPRGREEPAVPRPFTFGCFNYAAKINGPLIQLWSSILDRCPGSRLVLKNKAMADPRLRAAFQARFRDRGIDAARLLFLGPTPSELDHLLAYREIDVALDTHPYNGTTTTCEALWMGIPVLTWCGDRHASRVGGSLLQAVGLYSFVASSHEDYLQKAVDVFQGRLQRPEPAALREQIERSLLCNAPAFTASFMTALLSAWSKKVGEQPGRPQDPARSVWLNGRELKVEGSLGPRVIDCALSVSESMPEGRQLARAVADGRELAAADLEQAQFNEKLELTFIWDAAWLENKEVEMAAKAPGLLAQSQALAALVASKPLSDLLPDVSGFLQALAPRLEVQAQRLQWQAESGQPIAGSPLALQYEALSALMNRIMDALQNRQPEALRKLLQEDLPQHISLHASDPAQ